MDCVKIGKLISNLRKEKSLTQKEIASALGIQAKTVSKWETGLGCPDISFWADLSTILGVDMKQMMEGEITPNKPDSGNINRVRFYVCPSCMNVMFSTGSASIFCCGRKLEKQIPAEGGEQVKFDRQVVETDYYVTLDHPMKKEDYIAFIAFVKSDRIFFNRLYPEQDSSTRFPLMSGGKIYAYSTTKGLLVYSV